MVTLCLVFCLGYFLILLADGWEKSGSTESCLRFFRIVLMVVVIFGIIAVNNGFAFPTDFREIKKINPKE